MHRAFEARVRDSPSAPAVEDGERRWTYAELNARANRIAHHLVRLGIGAGDRVAVSLPRSAWVPTVFLAVLKAGAAFVPLDPSYPRARREHQLADSGATVVVTVSSEFGNLPSTGSRILALDIDAQAIAAELTVDLAIDVPPDAVAYVLYTSGSTGKPKGVAIHHAAMLSHSRAVRKLVGYDADDRVLQFSSIAFDIIIEELFPTLLAGGCVVVRNEEMAHSARAFLDFVGQHRITILDLPTAYWHEIVYGLAATGVRMPASVRAVLVGGEKASRTAYLQWRGIVGERPRWINTYGPTETTVICTAYDPVAEGWVDDGGEIPIGRPLDGMACRILDESGRPVAEGAVGELYVAGPQVGLGYLNLPEVTRQRFLADPFGSVPGARMYRTGDLARMRADGVVEFLGRTDHQVKLNGYRIELPEIEGALETHPRVRQAIVQIVATPDGQRTLHAWLSSRDGRTAPLDELGEHLRAQLPPYMVPRHGQWLEAFPLSPNGKVDRAALPAPVFATDPAAKADEPRPTDPIEAEVLGMWERLMPGRRIGLDDHFFELGGTSLLAARLFADLEQSFGTELRMSTILESPTVRSLAARLRQRERPHGRLIVPLRPGAGRKLFLVHDADGETLLYRNLAHRLPGDVAVYGIEPLSRPGIAMAHARVEDMARDYVSALRAVQPEGPYHVGGLCAGGVIAYEMAQQLERAGQRVDLVVMFDATTPQAEPRPYRESRERSSRLTAFLSRSHDGPLWRRALTLAKGVFAKAGNALRWELQSRREQRRIEAGYRALREALAAPTERGIVPVPALTARETYNISEKHYHPAAAARAEALLLVRGTQGSGADTPYREVYVDEAFGWRVVAPTIECLDAPGGHSSMLAEPHVSVIAEALTRRLDAAARCADHGVDRQTAVAPITAP